ncbi:MAG: DUF2357 domain-containing protein [Bacillota bacterium]
MASPHIGCKEGDLVFIETHKLDLTIKGMPCHPKAECLNLNKDTLSQIRVWCEEEFTITAFLQEEMPTAPNVVGTKPLFFEQQDYEIVIENKGDSLIEFWHENSLLRNKVRPVGKSQKVLSGILNFKSEIGFSQLVIKVDGKTFLKIDIEVFPSKVDYQKDYNQILQDVNQEIYNLAFDFLRKTYLWSGTRETVGNSLTEFFSIISILFEKFIGAVNIVIKSPHHVLQSESMIVPFHKLRKSNASTIKWLIKKPQYLLIDGNDYMPQKALMTKKSVSFDTFENRFIKYILNSVLKRLVKFKESYACLDKNCDEYVLQKIDGMYRKIQKRLEYSFLRNVGELYTLNALSLILNMAPGYKDVYKYYLILIKGLSLHSDLFKISVKDLAVLYEYWCFIKLSSLFRKKYKLLSQDLIKADYKGLTVTLKKGNSARVSYENPRNGERFTLVYNPSQGKLPTIPQRPDNILSLEKQKSKIKYEYIFDAKYRINPALEGSLYNRAYQLPGPEEDDINTMHRYRDAIVHDATDRPDFERTIFGAYVLFPYNNEEQYREHRFYRSIEKVNIGGLPFLPSATALVEEMLDELMEDSPESAFERAKLQRGTYEYLENIDFVRRDVLVGTLGSKEQFTVNLSHNFYHIPCEKIGRDRNAFQLKFIAMYQSKEKFGEQSGVFYYGEIEEVLKLQRAEITEIPTNKDPDTLYYKFKVVQWKKLKTPVKSCNELKLRLRIYTNLFLLENAEYVSELCIKDKEEYRLLKELKRISCNVNTKFDGNQEDDEGQTQFEFEGALVSIQGNKVRVLKGTSLSEYDLALLKAKPTAFMRIIKEFVDGN